MSPVRSSDAPTRSGFPGFGEGAPLDLTAMSDRGAEHLAARFRDGSIHALGQAVMSVGGCARPVRLSGSSMTVDKTTGEVLGTYSSDDAPLGVSFRRCGNRRESECPSCARLYARDTFEMIRAGATGGKTVPERVAANPLLFATLTAPSFGPVHGPRPKGKDRDGSPCHPRSRGGLCRHGHPVGCMRVHDQDDPANGVPLCGDCYDWDTAVAWQWWAPELWRRTTIALRRTIADALGVKDSKLGEVASIQYAKVAEYQARGMVHFHALIRLDGPTEHGIGSPAPVGLPAALLAELVEQAVASVRVTVPGVDDDDPTRVLAWGTQVEIRPVLDGHRSDDPDQPMTPEQVAGYLAKYATKDAGITLDQGRANPHLARLARTCLDLHARARAHDPDESPYLLLGKWSDMLGFRGHFSTKSRRYSVTLGRLRRARARYQALTTDAARTGVPLDTHDLEARLMADDDAETTLVIGSWDYDGSGWAAPAETALALATAARAREHAQWKAEQRRAARAA
jgi:hypothetical protein